MTQDLIIGIIASLIGAAIGFLIPKLSQFRINNQRKGLAGKWKSYGFTGSNKTTWIEDEVEVKQNIFGITLENTNEEFKYLAKGQLIDARQLSGTWFSKRPGAYDSGPFMFVISPQGNYMYGVYIGRNENGTNFFLGWCLGRDDESIENAKVSLKSHIFSNDISIGTEKKDKLNQIKE